MLLVLSFLLCLRSAFSGRSCENCSDLDAAPLLQSHVAAFRQGHIDLQRSIGQSLEDGKYQGDHRDKTKVQVLEDNVSVPRSLGHHNYFEACSKSPTMSTLELNYSRHLKASKAAIECKDTEITLQKETATGIEVNGCCPRTSTWCGGCEEQDGTQQACKSCQGGYVLEDGHCIRCQDGSEIENCFTADCSEDPIAQAACCKCGGGHRQATEFRYVVQSLVRGAYEVTGYPSPRTKGYYTVSDYCQWKLHEVGLTIGRDGNLYLTAHYLGERYTETHFEFQCIVTSEQPGGLTTTAVASFVSNEIAYRWPILVPEEEVKTSYDLVSYLPEHCDLKWVAIYCYPHKPIDEWLDLNWHTGELHLETFRPDDSTTISSHWCFLQGKAGRGSYSYGTSAEEPEEVPLLFQEKANESSHWPRRFRRRSSTPSTPSTPSAPSAPQPTSGRDARIQRRQNRRDQRQWWGCRNELTGAVQVLAPFQWQGMLYGSASATIGDVAPALPPKEVPLENRLTPFRFSIACATSIPGGSFADNQGNFEFDIFTGDGTIDGIPAFNMDVSTGIIQLDLSKSFDFIETLDFATSPEVRRSIELHCTAYGHYEYFPYAIGEVVDGPVKLSILDPTCWQTEEVELSEKFPQADLSSEGECRNECRKSVQCWAYQYDSDSSTCYFAGYRCETGDPSCETETVLVKYACEQGKLCVELVTDQWYLNGQYSEVPLHSVGSTAPVFLRSQAGKEKLYITDYDASFGATFSCGNGSSLILRPSSNEALGTPVACITPKIDTEPKQASITYQTSETSGTGTIQLCSKSCSTTGSPALTTVGIQGVDMNYDVEVLALGDPTTALPRDYWLHPCQCFPELYGVKSPVTQESFNDVPPGSGNSFIPSHYRISSGRLTCPSDALIPQSASNTLQGEASQVHCRTLCESEAGCKFYFVGTASQSAQCRLYSSCQHLIQEQMLEGSLFASARVVTGDNSTGNTSFCRIADPQKCFSVTMRRAVMGAPAESPLQNLPAPEDFLFYDLVTQCDLYLLLGGAVTSCGKLTYAKVDSHDWTGKTHLPESISNGAGLSAECWSERYAAITPTNGEASDGLLCVQGHLVWSSGGGDAAPLACGSCIHVTKPPYWTLQTSDKQEIYFPQMLKLKVERLDPISLLGLYTAKPVTCDKQIFQQNGTDKCLEVVNGVLTLETCQVPPPTGQLLDPESLPVLLESTYVESGSLVPPSNTSGTTAGADMFYGPLAGVTFEQHCEPGAVQSLFFPAKQFDSEGKGAQAITMAANCTYSDIVPGTGQEKIVQMYGTRFDSAGSSLLPGNVNWALEVFPNGTIALAQRSDEYSQLWGRFRVGTGGGILESQSQLGQCLAHTASTADGVYDVTLEPCNSSLATQLWRFESETQQLLYDISGGSVDRGLLFVDTNDTLRVKTCVGVDCISLWQAWVRWVLELPFNQDAPAKCGDGEVLTKIDKQEYRTLITCSQLRNVGSCFHKETPIVDVSASYINTANNLFNTKLECPAGYALQFFKTQTFGDEATSINFAYTCCGAGSGFRSATAWHGPDMAHFESWEGVYCPVERGETGYLDYVQRTSFAGDLPAVPNDVKLNKSSGEWCLSATGPCLQKEHLLDPPEAQDTWQANPVSNFDGDCVKGQVTQPLPFKRTELDSHSDTIYFGEEKESESSEDQPSECSPSSLETLPANHPCKAVWEKKITMDQIFDCFDRETLRQQRLRDLSSQMYNQKSKTEMREAYSSGSCASIPDIQSNAYTVGNVLTPGRVCQVQNELVFFNKEFAEGDYFEELEKTLFDSSNADCVGTKLGLAKVFCDLHCIKATIDEGNDDLASSLKDISDHLKRFGEDLEEKKSLKLTKRYDANASSDATASSLIEGRVPPKSLSQSAQASLVSHRAAMFAQRTSKLLQLRKQAVKAHEDAVVQVKERQRHLTSRSATEQLQDHSARQLLLDLDSTWWSIRSTIDSHLHVIRQFHSDFSDGLALLQGFSQHCSMQWEDVLKGYDKLSSTELEFKKGLQSMWLEVLPKAGLLSDQLLHGDAFSRLLEFDANSLNVSAILAKARDEEDLNTVSLCVDAMTSGLKPALSKGFAHQMLVQIRTVFAELASLRDRFHFEGMGEPEDSQLLAALLRQAEEAHETARTEILPTLVRQLATNECQQHIPSHKKIAQ